MSISYYSPEMKKKAGHHVEHPTSSIMYVAYPKETL